MLSLRQIISSSCAAMLVQVAAAQNADDQAPSDEKAHAIEAQFLKNSPLAATALGTYLDPDTDELVVVLPADASLKAAAADARRIGHPARLGQSGFTRQSRSKLEARILQRDFHPRANLFSYATYFDVRTGKQVLLTLAPPDVVEPILSGAPGLIEVRTAGVELTARNTDRPLFSGGAGYQMKHTPAFCTLGWMVTQFSYNLHTMVTAGHCLVKTPMPPYEERWYTLTHDNFYLGRHFTTLFDNTNQGPDVGWISRNSNEGATFRPYIYNGGFHSTTTMPVYGGRNPKITTGYCRSGSASGEVCGVSVVSVTASYVDPSGRIQTNMVAFTGSALGGDSGGPLYAYSESGLGLHVRGIITSVTTDGTLTFAAPYTTVMGASPTSRLVCALNPCWTGPFDDGKL